jgi:tetratricopeptide (TPR) repeat protein
VAVVVGAPGTGKSRLAAELMRTLAEQDVDLLALVARGDPMAIGSPFRMPAELVRTAIGIAEGEPAERQRERLGAALGSRMPGGGAERTAAFLGEMIGLPFPDDENEALAAARRDPRLMAGAIRSAFEDWLGAECARRPVLLVLDDLQWASVATIGLLDAALRTHAGRPLLVIALARPAIDEAFPQLWAARHPQRLGLRPLSARAAKQIVGAVLGGDAGAEAIARIVERAEGNAFYLEEHIRALAEGRTVLPESVLAMVQARLGDLDAESRRVLRAAAILGESFWVGAVRALTVLGDELGDRLLSLADRELIVSRPASTLAGEAEYAFRNALVREAAYAMLTDDDRRLGHRLAGEWLEHAGAGDAAVLATHFDRGDAPERAVPWYVRAAAQALTGYDYDASLARAARAEELRPDDPTRAALLSLRAEAHQSKGEFDLAQRYAQSASDALAGGTAAWFHALRLLIAAAASRGDTTAMAAAVRRAREAAPSDAPARAGQVVCLSAAAGQLWLVGETDRAEEILAHASDVLRSGLDEPIAAAWVGWVHAYAALREGDPYGCLRGMEDALAGFERAGDVRSACNVRIGVGYACTLLGLHARAEDELRRAHASAERQALPRTIAAALSNLGYALVQHARFEEARDAERRAVDLAVSIKNLRYEGLSRAYLALALLGLGDGDAAEREAAAAVSVLEAVKPSLGYALAVRAHVLLARGHAPEALEIGARAVALLATLEERTVEPFVRLAHAEALAANARDAEAAAAIADAQRSLDERAARIPDASLRASYLADVPENARIRAVAGARD